MIDKDDFEDFLIMNGKLLNEESKPRSDYKINGIEDMSVGLLFCTVLALPILIIVIPFYMLYKAFGGTEK